MTRDRGLRRHLPRGAPIEIGGRWSRYRGRLWSGERRRGGWQNSCVPAYEAVMDEPGRRRSTTTSPPSSPPAPLEVFIAVGRVGFGALLDERPERPCPSARDSQGRRCLFLRRSVPDRRPNAHAWDRLRWGRLPRDSHSTWPRSPGSSPSSPTKPRAVSA